MKEVKKGDKFIAVKANDIVYEVSRIDKKNNKVYLLFDGQKGSMPLSEMQSLFKRKLYKMVDNNFNFPQNDQTTTTN